MIIFQSRQKNFQNQRGFTLIELMVTLVIIGIVSGIAISVVAALQKSSRDDQRKSDLKKIQVALQQYFVDSNVYPVALDFTQPLTKTIQGSTRTYLSTFPTDPGGLGYKYSSFPLKCNDLTSTTNCYRYCLYTALENAPTQLANSQDCSSTMPSGYNYYASPSGSGN